MIFVIRGSAKGVNPLIGVHFTIQQNGNNEKHKITRESEREGSVSYDVLDV